MEGAFVANVVVKERVAILQQLVTEDEPLLLTRNVLSILDSLLHALDRVSLIHVQLRELLGRVRNEKLHPFSPVGSRSLSKNCSTV